jgi:hypothetical protein
METNHDGEIALPHSGHGVARLAGVSRASGSRDRIHIRRVFARRPAIDPAVPGIREKIDRPATRGLRAAFNTAEVPGVPVKTGPRKAIGLQVAIGLPEARDNQRARVAMGLLDLTPLEAAIEARAGQDVLAAIGHPVALDRRSAVVRLLDPVSPHNLGAPANIVSSWTR